MLMCIREHDTRFFCAKAVLIQERSRTKGKGQAVFLAVPYAYPICNSGIMWGRTIRISTEVCFNSRTTI